jgi:uncharacterized protein (UPF0335 family)
VTDEEDVYDPYATGRPRPGRDLKPEAVEKEGGYINGVAAQQLRSIVERIERLEEEKKAIADDIKAVYGEAKANGYDTKALRKIVGLRKKDAGEREEEEAILELYKNALGMV